MHFGMTDGDRQAGQDRTGMAWEQLVGLLLPLPLYLPLTNISQPFFVQDVARVAAPFALRNPPAGVAVRPILCWHFGACHGRRRMTLTITLSGTNKLLNYYLLTLLTLYHARPLQGSSSLGHSTSAFSLPPRSAKVRGGAAEQ